MGRPIRRLSPPQSTRAAGVMAQFSSPRINPAAASQPRTAGLARSAAEGCHGGAVPAALRDDEVKPLLAQGDERQTVLSRHGRNENAPVGAALLKRRGHRVVRAGLDGVASRTTPGQQPIDQDPRSTTSVTIDQIAVTVPPGQLHNLGTAASFESAITAPVGDALQPVIASEQPCAPGRKGVL